MTRSIRARDRLRRRVLRLAAAGMTACLATLPMASAQSVGHPSTIRLLVPAQPGGGLDAVARAVAEGLQARLGVTVVVENRPGAGGAIAANAILNGPTDGSQYMMTTDHLLILPFTIKNLGFDPMVDMAPVAAINAFDVCFAIHAAGSPATNLNDYLAQVRQDPKLEGFGISAPGSMSQFFGYVISRTSGVKLVPVPYRGAAPVMTDLVAGHVPAAIVPCRDALEGVRAGKVRLIATVQKLAWAPEVGSFADGGYDLRTISWIGMYASAKVPEARRHDIDRSIKELMTQPAFKERVSVNGFIPRYKSHEDLLRTAQETTRYWGARIRESGFVAQ